MAEFSNDVFISYSRKDKEFARLLEQALEAYQPPSDLPVPQRNLIVFRDEADFTGVEYHTALQRHLQSSASMIVICSPHARESVYVNDEVRVFAAVRGQERIVPVLLSGIPNNEAKPDQEGEKAFPEALMEVMEMPLAASFLGFDPRKDKISKGIFYGSWYTILANIYHISRGEIEERDKMRLARQRRIKTAIVSGVMVVLLILTAWALYQRDKAVKQSRIALSRQLAAQALSLAKSAPALALLLAREANASAPTGDAIDALFGTLLENSHLDSILTTDRKLVRQISFNHDGSILAALSISGVSLWDVHGRKPLARILEGTAFARDLGVSADGRVLAIRLHDRAGAISFWEFASGRPLGLPLTGVEGEREAKTLGVTFRGAHGDSGTKKEFAAHPPCEGNIERTAVGPGGRIIAVGCYDGHVAFLDAKKSRWKMPRMLSIEAPHREPSISLAFSPDGTTFASGGYDGSIVLWDLLTWGQMQPPLWQGIAEVKDLLFSPDGNTLASAHGDGTMKLWSMRLHKRLATPIAGNDDPRDFADHPNELPGNLSILWSEGARRRLAIDAVPRKAEIDFAEIDARGRLVIPSITEERTAFMLAVDPRNRRYAFGSDNKVVIKRMDGSAVSELTAQGAGSVQEAVFSADGGHVAAISEEGDVLLWEVNGQRLLWRADKAHDRTSITSRWALTFSPDGRWLATGGDDTRLMIWDAATGKKLAEETHSLREITSLAFRPDHKRLAIGQEDGNIVLLDTATWTITGVPLSLPGPRSRSGPLDERRNSITSLSFSPDSTRMVSGVGDGSLVLWLVDENDWRGRDLTGPTGSMVRYTAFSADGTRLVSVDDKEAILWDVDVNSWKNQACAIANRNLTAAEWKQYVSSRPYTRTCSEVPEPVTTALPSPND